MSISVVIPAYNEEDIISLSIEKLIMSLTFLFVKFEIIIVNDGSSDNTFFRALKSIIRNKNLDISILNFNQNKGKGHAVKYGLLNCKYDIRVVLDADLSVHPSELIRTFYSKDFDKPTLIVGNRKQIIKQPFYRIVLGLGFKFFVRWIGQVWGVKDTQCPFKVLYKIPDKIIKHLKIEGFTYDVELIRRIQENNIRIQQQDVSYFNTTNSKVTIRKTIRMFFDLFKV